MTRRPKSTSGPYWRGYIAGKELGMQPANPYPEGPDADEWARGQRDGDRRRQALAVSLDAERWRNKWDERGAER